MSGGTQTQTQTGVPPAWATPYYQNNAATGANLAAQPGTSMIAPMTDMQNQGLSAVQTTANGVNPSANAAQANAFETSGALLNPNANPYLQDTFTQAANSVQSQLASEFAGAGSNVINSLPVQSDEMNNLATQLYGGAYNTGLNAETQATALAPSIQQGTYIPSQQLYGAGTAQQQQQQNTINAPYNALSWYSGLLGQNASPFQGSTGTLSGSPNSGLQTTGALLTGLGALGGSSGLMGLLGGSSGGNNTGLIGALSSLFGGGGNSLNNGAPMSGVDSSINSDLGIGNTNSQDDYGLSGIGPTNTASTDYTDNGSSGAGSTLDDLLNLVDQSTGLSFSGAGGLAANGTSNANADDMNYYGTTWYAGPADSSASNINPVGAGLSGLALASDLASGSTGGNIGAASAASSLANAVGVPSSITSPVQTAASAAGTGYDIATGNYLGAASNALGLAGKAGLPTWLTGPAGLITSALSGNPIGMAVNAAGVGKGLINLLQGNSYDGTVSTDNLGSAASSMLNSSLNQAVSDTTPAAPPTFSASQLSQLGADAANNYNLQMASSIPGFTNGPGFVQNQGDVIGPAGIAQILQQYQGIPQMTLQEQLANLLASGQGQRAVA